MSILADFHMHSFFSGDSDAPMIEMVSSAIKKGLHHMCFTEHLDIDFPVTPAFPKDIFTVDMPCYLAEFCRCRDLFSKQIELHCGIELGLQPHLVADNLAFAKAYDFDFIIGSSHAYSGKNPCEPSHYAGRTANEVYSEYLQSILDNIRTFDHYDVFGHLDYILRYSPTLDKDFVYDTYRDYYEEILKELVSRGKGIEVNTGGLRKGLSMPHPCIPAIRCYRELGGEIITVGSDSHTAQDVGADFDVVEQILTSCGFRYYTIFQQRTPSWLPLNG